MRFLLSILQGFLIAALIMGAGTDPVFAKTKQTVKQAKDSSSNSSAAQPKGEWQVGMIRNDKGDFNYCVMRATYNNDLSLTFALSPKNEINIGVGVPKAGFGKEEKHQMKVTIDKVFEKNTVALSAEPELLIVPMGADKKLNDALRRGKTMTLIGAEDKSTFALKGTTNALQNLQACVDVGTGKVKAPAPQPQQAANKLKPGEFPPSLKGLLVKAGLKNLEIVPIKDPEKAPVDFAWRTEGVFGGMRERPVPKEATLEKMSEILEAGYKKQCSGMFNATLGDIENYSGIKLRKADIACQMKERNAYVALFFYLTDNGLFTMFMHEGDKGIANKSRDSIASLIRGLAKEQPPAAKQ